MVYRLGEATERPCRNPSARKVISLLTLNPRILYLEKKMSTHKEKCALASEEDNLHSFGNTFFEYLKGRGQLQSLLPTGTLEAKRDWGRERKRVLDSFT